MDIEMEVWEWKRVDPKTNCFRFYVLFIEKDFFNALYVVRKAWGRLGQKKTMSQVIAAGVSMEDAKEIVMTENKRREQHKYELSK